MTIALRNAQSNDSGLGPVTTLQITKPTGTVADDVLIFAVSLRVNTAQTFAPPSGFVLIRNTSGITAGRIATYYKVAGGSEPANYTMGWSSTSNATGCILGYSGVHTSSTIEDNNGAYNSATGADIVIPSVSAADIQRVLVSIYGSSGASPTWSPPAGMTEQVDRNATSCSIGAADQSLATGGATGTRTATLSVTTDYVGGQNIILTPATVTPTATPRVGMVGI